MVGDTDVSFNQTAAAGTPTTFGNNRFYANVSPLTGVFIGTASSDHGQQ